MAGNTERNLITQNFNLNKNSNSEHPPSTIGVCSDRQTCGPASSGQVPKIISLYYPVSKKCF